MNAVAFETNAAAGPRRRWALWTGWILSALPILIMLLSASMKLIPSAQMVDQFTGKFGYREGMLLVLGVLELSCAALYAIPRTAVLGAVLVTGYLGGAVATHVRIGDPGFVVPLALGVAAWGGLYMRDERLRALLPLRSTHRVSP